MVPIHPPIMDPRRARLEGGAKPTRHGIWRIDVYRTHDPLGFGVEVEHRGLQTVSGHLPAAVAKLKLPAVGRLPATDRVRLQFLLPPRDRQAIDALVGQLYDPASTNFHRFLAPAEYNARFAPSEADHQATIRFAQDHGLTVVRTVPGRTLVEGGDAVPDLGAGPVSARSENVAFFLGLVYIFVYTIAMNQSPTPESLLQQMAQISRMEPGKLCVLRQGPDGPYYNLQSRQNGKTVTRYVPRDQAELVALHTANHERFQTLVAEYVDVVADQTRAEREAGSKKKTPRPRSSWRKTRKSSS